MRIETALPFVRQQTAFCCLTLKNLIMKIDFLFQETQETQETAQYPKYDIWDYEDDGVTGQLVPIFVEIN